MDYNEFLLKAQYDLATAMPEAVISREQISKLQGESYEGFTVRSEGSMTGVVLNMKAMYERLEGGTDYNQILSDMLDIVDDNSTSVPHGIVDFLSDYSQVKENLTVDLVGQAQNEDRLSDIPHYDMEDLSLIYRVDVSDRVENDGGRATVLVTNQMLERYGVTPEQLHQDALKNASDREPFMISGMGMVLGGLIGMPQSKADEEPSLFVASNANMMFGASAIAYPGFMDKAAEKVQGDFYVLPSSVHEVLLLKDNGKTDYRDLEAMVSDINMAQVAPEERLSDRVYHYDSREKVFELAEKYEARTQGREEHRHSVLDDLKSFGEKADCPRPEKAKPAPAYGMSL
ncbi:MAG: DUF5688 family protein [Clostridiales bacterium]|nr:DUF5688 family protein [Clostridiales bacterium]